MAGVYGLLTDPSAIRTRQNRCRLPPKSYSFPRSQVNRKSYLVSPHWDPTDRPWYVSPLPLIIRDGICTCTFGEIAPAHSILLRETDRCSVGRHCFRKGLFSRDHGCCYMNTQRSRATTCISHHYSNYIGRQRSQQTFVLCNIR